MRARSSTKKLRSGFRVESIFGSVHTLKEVNLNLMLDFNYLSSFFGFGLLYRLVGVNQPV